MEKYGFYNPTRILFGSGRLSALGDLVTAFGMRCLLITTPNSEPALRPLYDRAKEILLRAGAVVTHFDEVVPNPTVQSIQKAIGIVRRENIDVIVALGGGSSIDTGKAVALFYQKEHIDWESVYQTYTSPFERYPAISLPTLPLIAVPTTAGTGSELTQAMVISDVTTQEKVCIFHPQAFPHVALIDPELTATMPPRLTAMTGFDAFCHAFESYVRDEASVYTQMLAAKAIQCAVTALPQLLATPSDVALRETMSQAAMFGGISLSNAAATVPHPLSEIIGGIAPRIPHGQALACLYPAFARFQSVKTPRKCAELARLMQPALAEQSEGECARRLPEVVEAFLVKIGLRRSLTELGVTPDEKEKMLSHFLLGVLPFGTPKELTAIMRGAFEG